MDTVKVVEGLRVHPEAWAKMEYMARKGKEEVSGLGLTLPDRPNILLGFNLLEQEVSRSSTEPSDEGVASYNYRMAQEGYSPRDYMRVWIHTHPFGTAIPSPSAADEEVFRTFFGDVDWLIVVIMNKDPRPETTYCNLRLSCPVPLQIDIPIVVDYSLMEQGNLHKEWDAEFQEKVKEKTLGFPGPQSWKSTTTPTGTTWAGPRSSTIVYPGAVKPKDQTGETIPEGEVFGHHPGKEKEEGILTLYDPDLVGGENMVDLLGVPALRDSGIQEGEVPEWVVQVTVDERMTESEAAAYLIWARDVYAYDPCNFLGLTPKEQKHMQTKGFTDSEISMWGGLLLHRRKKTWLKYTVPYRMRLAEAYDSLYTSPLDYGPTPSKVECNKLRIDGITSVEAAYFTGPIMKLGPEKWKRLDEVEKVTAVAQYRTRQLLPEEKQYFEDDYYLTDEELKMHLIQEEENRNVEA